MAELKEGFVLRKGGSCNDCVLGDIDNVYDKRELTGVSCSYVCGPGPLRHIVRIETGARSNDPHTSKVAGAKVKRASIRDHILLTLAIENPADGGGYAWTGTEIAAKNTGLRLNSITPRFAELRRLGKIKPTTTVRNGEIAWVLV